MNALALKWIGVGLVTLSLGTGSPGGSRWLARQIERSTKDADHGLLTTGMNAPLSDYYRYGLPQMPAQQRAIQIRYADELDMWFSMNINPKWAKPASAVIAYGGYGIRHLEDEDYLAQSDPYLQAYRVAWHEMDVASSPHARSGPLKELKKRLGIKPQWPVHRFD